MQKANYPPVPAFAVVGNVLPTLKPFFEFNGFLSRPENAKVIRQALEDSERFFREQDRALLACTVNNRWIGLERREIRAKGNTIPAGTRTVFFGGGAKASNSSPLYSYPVKTNANVLNCQTLRILTSSRPAAPLPRAS